MARLEYCTIRVTNGEAVATYKWSDRSTAGRHVHDEDDVSDWSDEDIIERVREAIDASEDDAKVMKLVRD